MKTAITLLFLSIFSGLSAQSEIRGRVLDAQTRKPVMSATVTMHPVGLPSILAYTMTTEDGTFILKHGNIPDTVTLTVSAMTIERQSKVIKKDARPVEFLVTEKTMELKEVIVKAPRIRQLGDTIVYDVASFTNEIDRSIGDVLKKLPGINVMSSGQILYQNKPISKFYIEGLDLLKGKYGLATQNVDASKVSTVQILENHQPLKVLKGTEIPEAAAINLMLKKSALGALFATAQLGVGVPAVLLSNELVTMRFTRMQQNMLVYKGDNSGRDISLELESFYEQMKKSQEQFLSVQTASQPSIDRQYALFNDAHMVSLNDLHSISKKMSLTSNISYLRDRQKSHGYSKRDIFIADGNDVTISENLNATLTKQKLDGKFTLERNDDNSFFNNELNLSSDWNTQDGDVITDYSINQHLKQPALYIGNDFRYIRGKGSSRKRIGSYVGYTTIQNSLRVYPSSFDTIFNPASKEPSAMLQDVSFKNFNANAYYSGDKQINKFSLGYSTNLSFRHYSLESDMFSGINQIPLKADSLRNSLKRNEFEAGVSANASYNFSSGLRPYLSIPIKYLLIDKKDKVMNRNQNRNHIIFTPSLNLQYQVNTRINISGNLSFSNGVGGFREDYLGYIMTSYRTLNRSDGILSKNRSTRIYGSVDYKNPFTTLFSSLYINYSDTWRNAIGQFFYKGIFSNTTNIYYPNHSKYLSISSSVGKSIDAMHSETRLSVGYDKNSSMAMNQGTASLFNTNAVFLSGNITSDIGRFMIFTYSLSYRRSISAIEDRRDKLPAVNNFNQSIGTSFIPVKKLSVGIKFYHYFNNMITSSARSSWFGNANVRYRMKNMDILLDWTNILNTHRFITSSYSDMSSYYSSYDLRPSELLLRMRFKIL